MRDSEFRNIGKHLMPYLKEFVCKKRLLLLVPMQSVVRGFCFEPAGFAKDQFFLWIFFQPLFVPAKEIRFTFGHRIAGGKRWKRDEGGLEAGLLASINEEIPTLLKLNNPRAIAHAFEDFNQPNSVGYINPHCREAFAYSLVRTMQHQKAIQILDVLISSIKLPIPWEREIGSRATHIRKLLSVRPDAAVEQLSLWEAQTACDLGLNEFLPLDP